MANQVVGEPLTWGFAQRLSKSSDPKRLLPDQPASVPLVATWTFCPTNALAGWLPERLRGRPPGGQLTNGDRNVHTRRRRPSSTGHKCGVLLERVALWAPVGCR